MSKLYRQLVSCEKTLRSTLITKTVIINPTSKVSQYRLQSYRFLVHAEVEYFIEQKIIEKVTIENTKWNTHGTITKCLSSLLAYTSVKLPGAPSRLTEISGRNDFGNRIVQVILAFEELVKKNHGIKEDNVIPLLISIGIDYPRLSQVLLNNLSSFGSNRGAIAHTSTKVKQLITPQDEIDIVHHIIIELKDVDLLIDQIK